MLLWAPMTRSPLLFLFAAGGAILALGAALWLHYGELVYFDWLSAALAYCFS